MTSIELRNVTTLDVDGLPVLDDVSLVVPSGSSLVVTGPRGAGKTALLRVLVGLDAPDSGRVLLDDEDVTERGPRARDVAMTFQDHTLHPHLDVFDNLAFSSVLRRDRDTSGLDDRVGEVADLLALGGSLGEKPARLDDAQQQRVALGRSLVRDARAHLFDEAFAAQPERLRAQVRSVTTLWQTERERTSVYATSDVAEALTLGDTVAVMHQGAVHQVGTPRELYESPRDLFVASFLGTPPMNLIPAFVSGQQLVMPLATMFLDAELLERIGERPVVIVGIRPETCLDATTPQGAAVTDRVEFTTRVDDVEWRGSTQHAYLGYDLEPAVEELQESIEERLDFDLFQSFLVAELGSEAPLKPGMSIRVVVSRPSVQLFDPDTGENLAP